MAHLRRAVQLLAAHPQITVQARSPLYESESVEGGGEGAFLNGALRISTTLSAEELLVACQAVEAQLGRPAPPRSGSRNIDLDILLFGEERSDTPHLTVPHPHALGRNFVLRPLLDVLEGGWLRPSPQNW